MGFTEYIRSYIHVFGDILRYRKTYKNYLSVIVQTLRKKYPINAVLRNGSHLELNNRIEVYATSMGIRECFDSTDDILTISIKDLPIKIKLYDGISNGDVCGVFLREEYRFLPVKERIIVDIGANIGDSAIYFAMHEAAKVIALEPFPKNYETARKNIELNNLSNKIDLILAGCSSVSRTITVDSEKESSVQSSLYESTHGIGVPLMTLESILKNYNINSAILKMDCEGCEYETILSASKDTLQKFSHIQIEYHYGYKNLKSKLENYDFKVTVTSPQYCLNYEAKKPNMYIGNLFAIRN